MQLLANVDVDDLEKAIGFYRDGLGLRVGRRFGGGGAEMLGASSPIYLLVKAAGSTAYAGSAEKRAYRRHWTPVHLDFVVDEIHAAVRLAVAAGARLEDDVETHVWGRIAHLADPFGHGICLIEFLGRGYDEIA
jgi:catechol 2,3-dioxygenase-like lactoylglutathione lyase family enzyme